MKVVNYKTNRSEEVTILFEFPVAHIGWEMDTHGWVVRRDDGSKAIVLEDHGRPYIARKRELKKKIAEFESWVKASRKALAMLK